MKECKRKQVFQQVIQEFATTSIQQFQQVYENSASIQLFQHFYERKQQAYNNFSKNNTRI